MYFFDKYSYIYDIQWILLLINSEKISKLFNIHFYKTDFFNKDITIKGDNFFFLGPLNFAKWKIYCVYNTRNNAVICKMDENL